MPWPGCADEAGAVDLVVTDQNMPGMSGVEVAAEVQRLRPGLRTVLISGHVSDALLAQAAAVGVLEVMAKQDSMAELGEAIREMLDTAGALGKAEPASSLRHGCDARRRSASPGLGSARHVEVDSGVRLWVAREILRARR